MGSNNAWVVALKAYAALLICFSLASLYYASMVYFLSTTSEEDAIPYLHILAAIDIAIILISSRAIYKIDLLSIKLLSVLTVYLLFSELVVFINIIVTSVTTIESQALTLAITSVSALAISIIWYFVLVKAVAKFANIGNAKSTAPNK